MKRERTLVILACILCWWPLPVGVGYLLLRRWWRFAVAFLGLQIVALTVVRMALGHQAVRLFSAVVLGAIIVDTLRLAGARSSEIQAGDSRDC